MTREQKIDRLLELEYASISSDLGAMGDWLRSMLRDGFKGFVGYTDEELDEALAQFEDDNDEDDDS
jgi:hypothetical protein